MLLEHMQKKFEINRTKIKCQSGRKVVVHNSKSDLPLGIQENKTEKAFSLQSCSD